jgi:hypothetical protein
MKGGKLGKWPMKTPPLSINGQIINSPQMKGRKDKWPAGWRQIERNGIKFAYFDRAYSKWIYTRGNVLWENARTEMDGEDLGGMKEERP